MLAAVTPATRAHHHQLAVQSDRRADDRRRDRAAGRRHRGPNIYVILDLCYEQLIYEPIPHNLPKLLATRLRDKAILCGSAQQVVRDDRLALRLGAGPGRGDRRQQRAAEPLDLERLLDLAEGHGRGAQRPGRHRHGDAGGIPPCAATSFTPG